jgi:predicted RNA-binding Zn-ribbon protein involved in translation (DUF1610 family)
MPSNPAAVGAGTRQASRKASIVRILLSYLAAEHVCVPPDSATGWAAISEGAAVEGIGSTVYACPECGQHLARSRDAQRIA